MKPASPLDDGGVYDEIHALSSARDSKTISDFLVQYVRDLPLATVLERPVGPGVDFASLDECVAFLLANPSVSYSLYWSGVCEGASLHFLADGALICAVVRDAARDLAPQLVALCACVNAEYASATGEQPPPETAATFIDEVLSAQWSIVKGRANRPEPA
jgi:hypothetical protein